MPDTQKNAVLMAMQQTSIDMSMVPLDSSFGEYLLELIREGKVNESRVDESCRRVLQLKHILGMLESPVPAQSDPLVDTVGQSTAQY